MEGSLSKHPLRCFCSRRPLLAMFGIDKQKKPYIHIRIFKQGRIYGEVLIRGGEHEIKCRECLRWHRIVFRLAEQKAQLVETQPPVEIDSLPELVQTIT